MKIYLTEYQMDEVVVNSLKMNRKDISRAQLKDMMTDGDRKYYKRLEKAMKTVLAYYEP